MQTRIQGADEAYQRGNAYYREGRRDKAAGLYRKAVGLFPKCVYVLMFVFWIGTDWSSTFGQLSTYTSIYLHLYPKQSSVKKPATCTPGRTSGRCCGSWASWRSPWRRTRGWVCVYMHVCMPVVNRLQYLTRHRHRHLYHHEDRRWPSCPRPATTTTWPSPTKCVDKCTQMCKLIGPHAPTNQTPTKIHTTNNTVSGRHRQGHRGLPGLPGRRRERHPRRALQPGRGVAGDRWVVKLNRYAYGPVNNAHPQTRSHFTFYIPPPPKKNKNINTPTMP